MTNYEKALVLLDEGVARKHYTFEETGYIILDLGEEYVGYISPFCKYVEVANGGIHCSYGNIDLHEMSVFDRAKRRCYTFPIKKWGEE